MITPIEFFKEQVKIWNENQYCGNCWDFGAPLSESGFEKYQLKEGKECCYQLIITDYSVDESNEYNTASFARRKTCNHRFTMYIVKASSIDINTYNEIEDHPINESKWETILKPLFECFSCDAMIDYCAIVGYPVLIPQWRVEKVINKHSNNYDGIKITGVFREIS